MDMQDPGTRPVGGRLAKLPERLHHYAIVIKDQERNRHFLEDILGIPLVATWCERAYNPDFGREIEYCHTFYALGDGGALAFFQFAEEEVYERMKPTNLETGQHMALKVDKSTYDEILRRVEQAGLWHRKVDHGYCASLYLFSPDNLKLEFACDLPGADELAEQRRQDAHSELARWLSGDRRVNNASEHKAVIVPAR